MIKVSQLVGLPGHVLKRQQKVLLFPCDENADWDILSFNMQNSNVPSIIIEQYTVQCINSVCPLRRASRNCLVSENLRTRDKFAFDWNNFLM